MMSSIQLPICNAIKFLNFPHMKVTQMFKYDKIAILGGDVIPWIFSSLLGEIKFKQVYQRFPMSRSIILALLYH